MFRRFVNLVLRILYGTLLRVEVTGSENVPAKGPFIAMINHIYFFDPVLLTALAPRFIVIMSKIENLKIPVGGWLLKLYGSFPVRRGEIDRQAIRTSLDVLRQGHGLMMAPEGTRSRAGSLQQGRVGMSWLALRSNAPIVPVAISGQEHLTRNLKRLRRTPVRLVFGKPFCLHPQEGMRPGEQRRRMTTEAMYRLAALLPPEYRGVYSNLEKASSDFLVPYEPPGGQPA